MPGFSWNLSRRARGGLERVMPSQGREEETARCSGRREELRGKVHLKSIHCCQRCKIHCIFGAVQMQGSTWILSRRGEDAKQRTERSQRGPVRKSTSALHPLLSAAVCKMHNPWHKNMCSKVLLYWIYKVQSLQYIQDIHEWGIHTELCREEGSIIRDNTFHLMVVDQHIALTQLWYISSERQ